MGKRCRILLWWDSLKHYKIILKSFLVCYLCWKLWMEPGHAWAARFIPAMWLLLDLSYCVCFALLFSHLPQEEGKCESISLALFAGVSVKMRFPRPWSQYQHWVFRMSCYKFSVRISQETPLVCGKFPVRLLHLCRVEGL